MEGFINECENMIFKVQELLMDNNEWISRYAEYAKKINANLEKIKRSKEKVFHEWAPLYLYMNVTQAKGQMGFNLRYLGQQVADLKFLNGNIIISTKKFDKNNERDFDFKDKLDNIEWKSKAATNLRQHFSTCSKRTGNSGRENEEHRIESMLLTEFSKKSKNKILCHIQPVKIASIARFQMPTPIRASDIKNLKYSKTYGGGIDIMSRIGKGSSTKLCIMELKDENDSKLASMNAIQQGLVYVVFIRELLRSRSGGEWWKIFGFSGKIPDKLELYVVCVMPTLEKNDLSFSGQIITTDNDSFNLNYIYFDEKDNKITGIVTSLKQCIVKNGA